MLAWCFCNCCIGVGFDVFTSDVGASVNVVLEVVLMLAWVLGMVFLLFSYISVGLRSVLVFIINVDFDNTFWLDLCFKGVTSAGLSNLLCRGDLLRTCNSYHERSVHMA